MYVNDENYKQFIENTIQNIKQILTTEYEIEVESIKPGIFHKNNMDLMGITIQEVDNNIAPTIYMDSYYQDYQEGVSLDDIAASISSSVSMAFNMKPELPVFTVEEAKKHITLTLINEDKNNKMLMEVPHFKVGGADSDVVAIPRWYISDEASFVVNNNIASHIGLTSDEIIKLGMDNINAQEFNVLSMKDLLMEMVVKDGIPLSMVEDMFSSELGNPPMIVVTNERKLQGASAILSSNTLKLVEEKLGGEYYILPSSIHESIAVPVEGVDVEELKQMVREINMTEVKPEDFLSDNVFKYDGNKLSMVFEDVKMDGPKLERNGIHFSM